MKSLFLIALLYFPKICFTQQSSYFDNPDPGDSLCISEVTRAQNDFKAGKLVLCPGYYWDIPHARMFEELDSICKYYGIILMPDSGVENDFQYVGYTYTCYEDFMNREIDRKFGNDFRKTLFSLADSIWKAKVINDTIYEEYIDIHPHYCHKDLLHDLYSNFKLPPNCKIEQSCENCELGVMFVVDTTGNISNYEFIWHPKIPLSRECIRVIQVLVSEKLNSISCWEPGKLGDKKVCSYVGLRIYFAEIDSK